MLLISIHSHVHYYISISFINSLYMCEKHLDMLLKIYLTSLLSLLKMSRFHLSLKGHTVKSYSSGLFSLFAISNRESAIVKSRLPVNPTDVCLSFYPDK